MVVVPLGYGLSHTTFAQEVVKSDVKLQAHGSNSISVKVTNTGDTYSGAVVQLYMQAPITPTPCGITGTGLRRPIRIPHRLRLAKTSGPGEVPGEVKVSFPPTTASFDIRPRLCHVLVRGVPSSNRREHTPETPARGGRFAGHGSPYYYDNEFRRGRTGYRQMVAKVALGDYAGDGNVL